MNGKETTLWSVGMVSAAIVLCCLIVSIRGCSEEKIRAQAEVKKAFAEAAEAGALIGDPTIRQF